MNRRNPLSNLSPAQISALVRLHTAGECELHTNTRKYLVNVGCIRAGGRGYVLTDKGKRYARIAQEAGK